MAKRRAVLHEPVVQEDLLALLDVPAGVEDPALRIDDSLRNRRVRHVRAVGQQPEDEEPAHDHQQGGLDPHSGNQQTTAFSGHALPPSTDCEAGGLYEWNQRSYEMPARPRALKRVFSDARVRLPGASASATFMAE